MGFYIIPGIDLGQIRYYAEFGDIELGAQIQS